MRHANGFKRVKKTLEWHRKRVTPDEPTPADFGWIADDDGNYYLPGVTDVHIEQDDRFPAAGWVLVYHHPAARARILVQPSLLGRMTELIKADNGLGT